MASSAVPIMAALSRVIPAFMELGLMERVGNNVKLVMDKHQRSWSNRLTAPITETGNNTIAMLMTI